MRLGLDDEEGGVVAGDRAGPLAVEGAEVLVVPDVPHLAGRARQARDLGEVRLERLRVVLPPGSLGLCLLISELRGERDELRSLPPKQG